MGAIRGIVLAGAAVALISTVSSSQAEAETSAVFDWTGFYLGGYGGAAFAKADVSDNVYNIGDPNSELSDEQIAAFNVLQHGTLKETLATFGVQAGHNFQLQKVVLGIHGDFGSLDFNESNRETGFWIGPDSHYQGRVPEG
jgi:opacity protein-like surface antigen